MSDPEGGTKTVTRRERNARFGKDSPELVIPPEGFYLWNWYFALSDRLLRVQDGVCAPIPPSEFKAWLGLTGEIVYPWEYDILCAMDVAFCDQSNKELTDKHERERPKAQPQKGTRR